eukprot:GHVR01186192.1.p1 GENE.GHVR01186192.1~~GHVR01186192.1.p1  ORF type:complete len:221 (-),score=22.52 GHVR01186192.1:224-886(-)
MKEINVTIIDKSQFTQPPPLEGMVAFTVDKAWRRYDSYRTSYMRFDMSKQKTYLKKDELTFLDKLEEFSSCDATSSALIRASMGYYTSSDTGLLEYNTEDIEGTDYRRALELNRCLQGIQNLKVSFKIPYKNNNGWMNLELIGPLVDKDLLLESFDQIYQLRKIRRIEKNYPLIDPILFHVTSGETIFGSKVFENMSFSRGYDFLYFYHDSDRFKIIAKI